MSATPSPVTIRTDVTDPRSRPRSLFDWLSSTRVLVTTTLVWILFAGVFFASAAPFSIATVEQLCGAAPLDVRFSSTGADVLSFLDACGTDGRGAYRAMQLADLLYPLVFGLWMASICSAALKRVTSAPWARAVPAVIIFGVAFDYLENLFVWRALSAFPEPTSTNELLGIASAAKTSTFWLAGAVLVAALVVGLWRLTRSVAVATVRRSVSK